MVEVKKVLVLYVGGTIGMEKNKHNAYVPSPNRLFEYIKANSEMHHPKLAQKYTNQTNQLIRPQSGNLIVMYDFKEYEVLLDSSNMSSKDWVRIAKDVETHYDFFDGFVILHGTDTLAYTSSALSFMLEGLKKPVILTGSQIPIFEKKSDAQDNILSSLLLAAHSKIPEVCIFFAQKLLRGNRTAKISSTHLDAFDSPNYHTLADVEDNTIKIHKSFILKRNGVPLKVHSNLNSNVGLLTFFPTITPSMLRALLQSRMEGLVIQSYGLGNIPSNQIELVQILEEAVQRGTLVVNTTLCSQGSVSSSYETGKAMEDIGIISGNDMTAEAALTKLCFVLGLPDLSHDERIMLIKENIRGEFTEKRI